MTVLFVVVIAVCTLCTILLNSIISKIGRVERTQREFEFQLTSNSIQAEQDEVITARESYTTAVEKYNESIGRFPGMVIAGIFGFTAIHIEQKDNL